MQDSTQCPHYNRPVLRATIWLCVLAWAGSELARGSVLPRFARALFTAGALLLVVHTILAFSDVHGWSHRAALAETARQTEDMTGVRSGAGLYLNYLFIALWIFEAAWWWASPHTYQARSRALDLGVFGFFAFMMVNGAVVFAAGPMRIAGAVAIAAALAARFGAARRLRSEGFAYD